jgi:spore germination protein YaaH
MTVLGYATYYYNGDQSSLNSMIDNTLLDDVVTHAYSTDGLGNLSGIIPIEQIEYAKDNGIKVYASVTNSFKGEISNQVLFTSINRNNLINNIKLELDKYGFSGVNMDMEGIYYYDRDNYSLFIKELYEVLSPLGYEVSIAVPAKTYDNPTNSWNGAFDYIELAKYSDKIVLMTYDEHFGGGNPGPIASIGWVEQVLDYSTTTIPKEKIILGLAAYGYDWSSNPYSAYGVSKSYEIAYAHGAAIIWDNISQSPYYNYTDSNGVYHTVWFENEYSIEFKLRLVNSYGIDGIAIWRLGLENPAYWEMISKYKN